MPFHVEPIDWATADVETLLQAHELFVMEEAEGLPGDPPIPFAERLAHLRMTRSNRKKLAWLLYEDGAPRGLAEIKMGMADNLSSADLFVFLDPEVRGQGLSKHLVRPAVIELEKHDRTRVVVEVFKGAPSVALLEGLGFTFGIRLTRSRLRIDEVDHALMRRWIESAQERAADYELIYIEHRVPDDLVDAYAGLLNVMNTAPRENLEEEDEVFTTDDLREVEDNFAQLGAALPSFVARHRSSGELAGFTNVSYSTLNPAQIWQWGTGVDPAHRNKGLGRWLKAAMIEKLVESMPRAERVDTWNAGSNEPMLNINIAMGFKPIVNNDMYQGNLERLKTWAGDVG